jgi:hypothetical protein
MSKVQLLLLLSGLIILFAYYTLKEDFVLIKDFTYNGPNPPSSFNKSINTANILTGDIFNALFKYYDSLFDTPPDSVLTDPTNPNSQRACVDLANAIKRAVRRFAQSDANTNFCTEKTAGSILIPNVLTGLGASASEAGILNRRITSPSGEIITYPINALDNQVYEGKGGFDPVTIELFMKTNVTDNTIQTYVDSIKAVVLPLVYQVTNPADAFSYNVEMYNLRITLPDPLHETVISSYLNYLYEDGDCMHITKIYGANLCETVDLNGADKLKFSLITERSTMSLYDFIHEMNAALDNLNPTTNEYNVVKELFDKILGSILIQVLYSFVYIKKNARVRHFDMHPKNILLAWTDDYYFTIPFTRNRWGYTYTDANGVQVYRTIFEGKSVLDYKYRGKRITRDNVRWFRYQFVNENNQVKNIDVENFGLIVKNIDFGSSSFEIPLGGVPGVPADYNKLNPEFYSVQSGFNRIDEAEYNTRTNKNAYHSMEAVFIILNLLHSLSGYRHLGFRQPVGTQFNIDGIFPINSFGRLAYNILSNVSDYIDNFGRSFASLGWNYVSNQQPLVYHPPWIRDPITTNIGFVYPSASKNRWFMNRRDVVATDSITPLFEYWTLSQIFESLKPFGVNTNNVKLNSRFETTLPPAFISNQLTSVNNPEVMTFSLIRQRPDLKPWPKFLDFLFKSHNSCLKSKRISNNTRSDPILLTDAKNTCKKFKQQAQMFLPSNTVEQNLADSELVGEWDLSTVASVDYFYFNINPALYVPSTTGYNMYTGGLTRAELERMYTIDPETRMFNFQPPSPELANSYFSAVNFHVLRIDNSTNDVRLSTDIGKDLWTVVQDTVAYNSQTRQPPAHIYVVNGGYFVVGYNVRDRLQTSISRYLLGDNLTQKTQAANEKLPLGFYMSTNNNGSITTDTVIEFPEAYKFHLAAIYIVNNQIRMMKYREFLLKHELRQESQTIEVFLPTGNRNITIPSYSIETSPIRDLITGQVSNLPYRKTDIDNPLPEYTSAFVSGPILIWDSTVVFTRDIALGISEEGQFLTKRLIRGINRFEKNAFPDQSSNKDWINSIRELSGTPSDQIPDLPYKVSQYSRNNKMFYAEPGEKEFSFGMRHSGQIIEVNAICELLDGTHIIVMCEGRGYDALGLTRYQFADIINKSIPNIRHAVCLDGGFSAQMLMRRKNGQIRYAMPDPEKRGLGISIIIQDLELNAMIDSPPRSP